MTRDLFWRLLMGLLLRVILVAILLTLLWVHAARSAEPTPQLVLPCEVTEVYDGDTVTVRVTITARVRLLDCWTAEVRTRNPAEKELGLRQRDALRTLVGSLPRPARLTIPLQGAARLDDVFTLGRLLGSVTLEGESISLSDQMCRNNHAFATKEELLRVLGRTSD